MGVILKNNAVSTITTAISASDVGLAVAAGTGTLFPTLGAGDYFYATLVSAGGTYEVIKVTARVGDTMTIVRAQEGTTAQSFASGSRIEVRVTAASITDMVDEHDQASEISFTPTGSISSNNVQDAIVEVNTDLAASGGSSLIGYTAGFTGATGQTVQSKLEQYVSVKDFGAVGDGVTDDTAAIQAAMTRANNVEFPRGIYLISSTLTFSRSYQRLFGASMGGYFSAASGGGVELKWNGAAAGVMMRVPTGLACPQIERLAFNANDLANNCLHLDVRAGSSIQFPYLERLAFRGYRDAALILGENDRVTIKNGALQQLTANHLTWWGGGAGATPANVCGVLLNAQNCEFASAMTWLFDPFTSVGGGPYINHYNHIVGVSGGLNLTGVTSTRSTSHAILLSGDPQLLIDGWRSEDVLLVDAPSSSTITMPLCIKNLLHRAGNAPGNAEVITLRPSGSMPLSVENSYIRGLIGLGASTSNAFNLKNVVFHEIRSGTCQSATASTCVLDAGASAVDNYYQYCELVITGGTGAGQSFLIASYVGSTKTATITGYGDVNTFFPVPDNTSTFIIRGSTRVYSGGTAQTASIASQPGKTFDYTYAPQALQFNNSGTFVSGLRNGSLRIAGIGGSGYSRNLGGAFQHVNADGATKTVTFAREERDALYRVQLVTEAFTGSPSAGSDVYSITKSSTGFTVTFNAGVGVGNTRTWTWMIFRD